MSWKGSEAKKVIIITHCKLCSWELRRRGWQWRRCKTWWSKTEGQAERDHCKSQMQCDEGKSERIAQTFSWCGPWGCENWNCHKFGRLCTPTLECETSPSHPAQLVELSFNSVGLFCQELSWSLWYNFFIGCFACKINYVFPLVMVHAQRSQNEFGPQWPIQYVVRRNLHTSTCKHAPNINQHGSSCMQNNQIPIKSHL